MGPLPELVQLQCDASTVAQLFERVGLSEALVDTPHARIPLHSLIALFEAAGAATDDPLFGFKVGQKMQPQEFGTWVRYSLASPRFDLAIQRFIKSAAYYQGRRTMTAHRLGDKAVFAYAARFPATIEQRHHADHVIAPMLSIFRRYTGRCAQPSFILVPYEDTRHRKRLEDLMGIPVVFAPALTGIAFDPGFLATQRCMEPNPVEQPTFADLRAMVRARAPRNDVEVVTAIIHTQMLDRQCSLDATARAMNWSGRSLQRRLMLEGFSFRELVERVRRARAAALLIETETAIADIAVALGYEDTSHFGRAFRRWFNTTPSAFRSADTTLGRPAA